MSPYDPRADVAAGLFEALAEARKALAAASVSDGDTPAPVVEAIEATITRIQLAITTLNSELFD